VQNATPWFDSTGQKPVVAKQQPNSTPLLLQLMLLFLLLWLLLLRCNVLFMCLHAEIISYMFVACCAKTYCIFSFSEVTFRTSLSMGEWPSFAYEVMVTIQTALRVYSRKK